jgi:1,4-dihydroxy-2-naphthoyl-CoA hydrolase
MPRAPAQVSALDFDNLYGLEVLDLGRQRARARVPVRDRLKDDRGHVRAGVYAAVAEGLVTFATRRAVEPEGKLAAALSLQTSFVEPIAEGSISVVADVRHRGRTTWVWEVEISDDRRSPCAFCRVTVAVREGSGPA